MLAASSCMPTAGLQSGRSLGKGNGVITPYIHGGDMYLPRDDSEAYARFLPSAGAQFATGSTDRLDLGGKVDLSSFLTAQVRYQLLGNRQSTWAVGAGAEFGLMLAPVLIGGTFYYYSVPVIVSYHPTERLCVYANPRYTFGQRRVVENANGSGRDAFRQNRQQSGFAYGVLMGSKNKFSLEVGHFSDNLYQPTQVALSYTIWFDK